MTIHRLSGLLALCAIVLFAGAPAAAQPAATSMAWRTDVPCTAGRNPVLTVADTPRAASVPGCVRAHCIALPDGRRVCACTGDTTVVVRVEQGAGTVHEWPADYGLSGSAESLRAMHGDLDADGTPELIVAEWMDMSNGLGIRYYRLSIINGADPARPPLRVNVDDFAPDGSFVRPAGGGTCWLLATRWTELRDPRRGEGMYFTGQWMRYRDGRLEHDAHRPVVVRRLLNSFRPWEVPGGPLAHFRDRRAEAWSRFPAVLPPLAGRMQGRVLRVRGDTVELSMTPQRILGLGGFGEVLSGPSGETSTFWLVDATTGRPYPRGYESADPQWLQQASATIRTYRDEGRVVHLLIVGPEPSAN
jgi:hypothetical protein